MAIQGLDPISDFLLAILILHLGLLFIINSPSNRMKITDANVASQKYNQAGLILYGVIWFLAHIIVFGEENYYLIIFQTFLFFGQSIFLKRRFASELG